jgi:hypothetical protein
MKPILLLFAFAIFFFSACTSKYQYLTVTGRGLTKNNNREILMENDTVRVIYNFQGYKGELTISIYNKSGELLEVNWRKSFLIRDEQAAPYYRSSASLNGSAGIDTTRGLLVTSTTYTAGFTGDITINFPGEFIPPRSAISKKALYLNLKYLPDSLLKHQPTLKLKLKSKDSISYKRRAFSSQTSPLTFRSYLTFNMGGKEFSLDHNFFIEVLWQSSIGPSYFPVDMWKSPDVIRL